MGRILSLNKNIKGLLQPKNTASHIMEKSSQDIQKQRPQWKNKLTFTTGHSHQQYMEQCSSTGKEE